MKARVLPFAVGASLASLFLSRAARADELVPTPTQQDKAITSIAQGIKEISPESIFVLGFDKRGDADDFRMTLLVGGSFRYFVGRNTALGFNLSFLYKNTDGQAVSSDIGGVLGVNLGYYASLGGGMFFKPLIGVGGFYARHVSSRVVAGVLTEVPASSFGGIVRPGFNFVFYSSPRFNMYAGPEVMLSIGGSSSEEVSGVQIGNEFLFSVDGGFNFGISYVF